jgi:hypothetical protein
MGWIFRVTRFKGLGFRVQGLRCRVRGAGSTAKNLYFKV